MGTAELAQISLVACHAVLALGYGAAALVAYRSSDLGYAAAFGAVSALSVTTSVAEYLAHFSGSLLPSGAA